MKLIVGLGNPGKEYENTRHNAGFLALDEIAETGDFESFQLAEKHKGEWSAGTIAGEKALLLKPQTFMNLSGQSVMSLANFYKIEPKDLIVIYDDADLPVGSLRIRPSGSAGGHNGMASLIQLLGTQEIPRVRLGIRPEKPFRGPLEDFVLGKLKLQEKQALYSTISRLPELLEVWFSEGIETAMNRFNA